MAIKKRDQQMLTYVTGDERREFDEAVDELEVSRAELMRQCILDFLERRRESGELLRSAGDFTVVDQGGHTIREGTEAPARVRPGSNGFMGIVL